MLSRVKIIQKQQFVSLVDLPCRRCLSNEVSENKINKRITIRNEDNSQKTPLVCLFGWGNGKKEHIQKYSEIYEDKGHTTMIVTTTLLNSLFRISTAGARESKDVQKVLGKECSINKDREIIFHSFSNGGCAISHLTTRSILNTNLMGNIKGHVFDSCPIIPNLESSDAVERAFSQLVDIPALKPTIKVISKLMVKAVVHNNTDVKDFMKEMTESTIKTPQLFLFSKSDKLAPYQDILDFIGIRKSLGIDTTFMLWDKSNHCAHLRENPEKYKEEIDSFVDKCITQL